MGKVFRFGDRRDWFLDARFGLFIHWGIYAIPGWHEQHVFRKHLTRAEYVPLMRRFNPVKFDPEAWLDRAEAAGMRYLCFTTKHIDGFCLWATGRFTGSGGTETCSSCATRRSTP